MQHIKTDITIRAFRETGTLILFYPEGRTYSPLAERQAVVVRSARRIKLLRKPTDNEHLFGIAVIVRTDGCFTLHTVCLRKSATGSFIAAMSIVYATLIFFLRKETKTERMMIFIGNIPP